MKRLILSLIVALVSVPSFAKVDSNLVLKAEKYLNGITGMQGEFSQTVAGKQDFGTFSMLRPGRIRLDYNTAPIQLVSNGKDLYFYEKSLDQITTIPLTSTPAGILVRKNINLTTADIVISETATTADSFWLKMHIKGQEGVGFMNVEFAQNPIGLKSWIVHDATGTDTKVAFQGMKTKTNFAKNYFELSKMKAATNAAGDPFYE